MDKVTNKVTDKVTDIEINIENKSGQLEIDESKFKKMLFFFQKYKFFIEQKIRNKVSLN